MSKLKSSKVKWFTLSPFNTKYALIVGETPLKSFMKSKKLKTDAEVITQGMAGLTIPFNNGHTVVWLSEHEKEAVNTIIHESVHVFQASVKYVMEETVGDEFQAYSIAEISCNLLQEHFKVMTDAIHAQGPENGKDGKGLCEGECPIQLSAGAEAQPV